YGALGVVYLSVPWAEDLESVHGWQYYDEFIKHLAGLITDFRDRHLNREDTVVVRENQSSEFIIFTKPDEKGTADITSLGDLSALANGLKQFIINNRSTDILRGQRHIAFNVGSSRILGNMISRPERIIYQGVEEARQRTLRATESEVQKSKELLQRIIVRERIQVTYQPIVDLKHTQLYGLEALSSATDDCEIAGAEMLFSIAEDTNLSIQLDRVCRRLAFRNIKGVLDKLKLFINSTPQTIEDMGKDTLSLIKLFEENDVNPENIVLEVTERSAISNFREFEAILGKLRETGVKIAVDDAGSGYSTLNTIARLKPDYLKFDMALVRGIDKDKIKQDLLLTVKDLSDKIGSKVIAEGIETKGEFDTIKSFNVQYGQGYYLSRPKLPGDIISHIRQARAPA
ncbi:MAG: EAL domain-containing protein, partial [bacterium]|nr:EAL domain-containing protein [bacterium]